MKARVASLHLYPIKGARGIDLAQAGVSVEGLCIGGARAGGAADPVPGPRGPGDREWMVVDAAGRFITQRSHPRLALVTTAVRDGALQVGVPGHASIDIPLAPSRGSASREVVVWRSTVRGFDEGDAVAQALSACLGDALRLVRFDAALPRPCNPDFAGDSGAHTRFADGYPVLVIGAASLDALNDRMGERGAPPLPMNRFRPNIVVEGLEPYDEDHLESLAIGDIVLRNVKPCLRCEVTATDQATAVRGDEPLVTLSLYRQHALGGVAFGVNMIVAAGAGGGIARGDAAEATLAF